MQEINIRKGELSDLPYLYEICLKTGENGKDATELFHDEFLIGQYYAAPYLVFPSGICIVAELNFRPQGYVIAAPDSIAFDKWMEEQWLPPLRNRYAQLAPLVQGSEFTPSEYIRSKKEAEILKKIFEKGVPAELQPWFTDYPAHLHIDLLPTLQG
ncbi:MAG: hypothetical protein LBU66_02860, partial [Treponema sp.]|nr:hypothetical protein [Treponema sp.]